MEYTLTLAICGYIHVKSENYFGLRRPGFMVSPGVSFITFGKAGKMSSFGISST